MITVYKKDYSAGAVTADRRNLVKPHNSGWTGKFFGNIVRFRECLRNDAFAVVLMKMYFLKILFEMIQRRKNVLY